MWTFSASYTESNLAAVKHFAAVPVILEIMPFSISWLWERIRARALLAYTLHWHIYRNQLISAGIQRLLAIGNRERKTNLFVPCFIFMRLLIKHFDWHPWYMVSAFFRSSWGLGSPITHFHFATTVYCGSPSRSKLYCDELPTWEFLGHLNPSLTEISSINNLAAPMPNASGSVDRDLWQLPSNEKWQAGCAGALQSKHRRRFRAAFISPNMLGSDVLVGLL